MNEKKTLNFDFLDEGPKRADEKNSAPTVATKPTAKADGVNFFGYFRDCYTNFSKFAQEHLVTAKPRYLILAIWVLGIGSTADRLTNSNSDLSTWGEVWAGAIFGGILAGAITYYIAGWFYHVRVGWSKGSGTINTSRNIYVFSSLPIAVTSIGSLLFNHMAYGSNYFNAYKPDASSVDIIFGLLALAAIAYSIYISYRAVRDVMCVQKGRGLFWFVIAPAIFYILIIAGAMFE
jgi:hypothetical protein